MDRRRFLKYAGAAVAAGTATGFGVARYYDVFDRAPVADFDYAIPDVAQFVPVAYFDYRTPERTLKYIAPNSDEEIQFLNMSTYVGNNPLSCSLYVDNQLVTTTTTLFDPTKAIYSTKLPASAIGTEHNIRLEVRVTAQKDRPVDLLNRSYDPDTGLPSLLQIVLGLRNGLAYEWFVDGQKKSTDRDYSLTLAPGDHKVGLNVSDGRKEDSREEVLTVPAIPDSLPVSMEKTVSVDPADLPEYPKKQLKIPIKGICMNIGTSYDVLHHGPNPDFPAVGDDELAESLYFIRKELGCNAVRFTGSENDRMISAVRIAKGLNFKTIMASPQYINADIDTMIQLLSPLVDELEALRDASLVLNVANELYGTAYGIIEGKTSADRDLEMNKRWNEITTSEKYLGRLNRALESILKAVRPRFGGKLTYSKHLAETVRWRELGFDIVSANDYYNTRFVTEEGYIERINSYTQLGLPAFLTEFGYDTYDSCMNFNGDSYWYVTGGWKTTGDKQPAYSQEAQAHAMDVNIQLLNRTRLDAIYLWNLIEKNPDEQDIVSNGVIKFSRQPPPWKRKISSYAFGAWVTR
jgi:hypothetical protein